MISRFPRRGYFRPLSAMTTHELFRYGRRSEAEACAVEEEHARCRAEQLEIEASMYGPATVVPLRRVGPA